ncbi:hypothetical protein CHLNCDRAFT_143902 [Chlorella variabilis]|uniref:Uncharacterized protein n=1 Tax=Chlorella variabilis TaxID=554065 RepID=E1ZAP7_CHLVA|nr:hypothetical protein CHLNCDRAFT_143902 [Chlorella variabilis]EFN57299.1 hypothetical protein CHLNCDRAFT_143902 [Chlorella variabilis]|eukprot:XP_005849401.1 hypothetical protein CHLNCDRAFT_143902 [Chlorella variabilis]
MQAVCPPLHRKEPPPAVHLKCSLSTSYCDEFVCTSSPSVEASVRQLAKDLQRANGRWAPIYASTVEYRDAYRRFKGPDGYQRLDFVSTNVQQAAVAVTGMRMLDNSSAEIRWRLTGKLGVLPIDVAGTTEIEMNLLTGRIERHREKWDLAACSPPAAAAWNASRALWAAKQASGDAQRAAGRALDTLTSVDDEDQYSQPNPNDPGRFFQQGDTFKQDAALFVGVVMLFWGLVQAWASLFSGSSGGGGAF